MRQAKDFIAKLPDIKISDQIIFKKYSDKAKLWSQFFLALFLNKAKFLEENGALCVFQKDFFDKTWQLQSLPLGEERRVIQTLRHLTENKLISKMIWRRIIS